MQELVDTFVNYGLEPKNNIFTSSLWYTTTNKELRLNHTTYYRQYYRFFSRRTTFTDELIDYSVRAQKIDFYMMRFWIVKYDQYLILNLYWFQPLKKRRKRFVRKKEYFFFQTPFVKKKNSLRRLKLVVEKIFKKKWLLELKYTF